MTLSGKIFDAFTSTIKMNDTVTHLANEVRDLAKEVRSIDRRLIRLETFVEIAEKQRLIKNKT